MNPAAGKDLFTCKVVGWAMDSHMKAELVGRVLFMAVKAHARAGVDCAFRSGQSICERGLPAIAHPVRPGAVDEPQRKLLGARSLALGHNAPMESWFASLKKEEVHLTKYTTRAAAKTAIFDYVEVF